jgi:hypothetical protein
MHFDDSKLHHVAAKCGVFAETDIVNLVKSGIPAREILCSLADAIVLQNLSVLTRGSTLKHKVLCSAGPTPTCPSCRSAGASASPRRGTSAATTGPKDRPIEETGLRPENAQYYAAFGACVYGLREAAEVGALRASTGLVDYMTNGARRASARARARPSRDAGEVDDFRELYAIPKFVPMKLAPGSVVRGGDRARRRLDLVEGRARSTRGRDRLQGLPALEGQPHPGHQGAAHPAPRARGTEPGATLEVLGFGATGYAADVLQECCAPTSTSSRPSPT